MLSFPITHRKLSNAHLKAFIVTYKSSIDSGVSELVLIVDYKL